MHEEIGEIARRLARLEDRIAVQDRIWGALIYSDLGEWAKATACYTDDATVDLIDYDPSIWPDPKAMPVAEFRRLASQFMPGFEVRQHQVTNFQIDVEGDLAVSRSQVRAIHLIAGRIWEAHATYRHGMRRENGEWKIRSLTARIIHQSGDDLIHVARRRVASSLNERGA